MSQRKPKPQLELDEAEIDKLYAAVIYARDTAFVNCGDKRHPSVLAWQSLIEKLKGLRT